MEGKRAALISFTDRGGSLNLRLSRALTGEGYRCACYEKRGSGQEGSGESGLLRVEESVGRWTAGRFGDSDCLIFIGAMGIAVRSIAPCIRDKWTDPAVVVIDEAGQFAISVLSGHAGGANELAVSASQILGAVPVVTTATDVNRRFAVDVFAVKNRLEITDRTLAKEISAEILAGGRIGVFSDYPLKGPWPDELTPNRRQAKNVRISRRIQGSLKEDTRDTGEGTDGPGTVLTLVPRVIHVGVGCRRGTPGQQLLGAVFQVLSRYDCSPAAVAAVASIDLKQEEPGLLWLAEQLKTAFRTYSAGELARVEGVFEESDFVRSVTGVGNVCERAAKRSVLETGQGVRMLCPRQVVCGVTVALAEEAWKGIL